MALCTPSCSKFTHSSIISFSFPHSFSVSFFFSLPSSSARPTNFRCFLNFQRVSLRSNRHCRPLFSSSGSTSDPAELLEAQDAVSKFLQEFGVSEEESRSITSNSPGYLRMLVDAVRDLDEFSMWDKQIGGFQEKVVQIAREKGDKGKVAYLESLGLSLFSAMNVARHLSAETLPALIHRVIHF